jgi:hypothetical protein
MEYYRLPDEFNRPPKEHSVPPETAAPAPELREMTPEIVVVPEEFVELRPVSAEPSSKETGRSKSVLRKLFRNMAAPVAATVATVTLFFAAAGYDPLGNDLLNNKASAGNSSPPSLVTDDTPTPTPTEEPATPTPTPTPELLNFPENSVPGATVVTRYVMHADNEPDYHFASSPCDTEEEAFEEVREWLKTWGGNPRFLPETSRENAFKGYEQSDDFEYSGTLDSPDSFTILKGTLYAVYQEDIYCDAYLRSHGEGYYEFGDDSLPKLPNLAPDFAGDYAWSTMGSEEYVRMFLTGDSDFRFLQMGGAWASMGGQLTDVPGATYDASTNTLTLENCTAECIDVNLMGNSFTIHVIGDNHIGYIQMWGAMYAGSVTFSGDGMLTINEQQKSNIGLLINGEGSPSAILVDRGVDIEIYGQTYAIAVADTTLSNPICFVNGQTILGGGVRFVDPYTADDGTTYYNAYVKTPDGNPATYVTFEPID